MAATVVDQPISKKSLVADMPLDGTEISEEGKENIQLNVDRQTPLKDTTNQGSVLSVTESSSKNAIEMRKKLEEWRAKKGRLQPRPSVLTSHSVSQPSARKSILATRQSLLPPRCQTTTPAKTIHHRSDQGPAKSEAKPGKVSTKPLQDKAGEGPAENIVAKPVGKVKPRTQSRISTAGPAFSRNSAAQARPAPRGPGPVAEREFVAGIQASSSHHVTSTVRSHMARKSIAVMPRSGVTKAGPSSRPAPAARRSLAPSLASARAEMMPNPSTKPTALITTLSRSSSAASAPVDRRSNVRASVSQKGPTLTKKTSQPTGSSRPSLAKAGAAGDAKLAEKTRHQGKAGAEKKASKKDGGSPSSSSDSSRRLSFTISSGPNPELEVKLSGKKDVTKRQEVAVNRRSAPAMPQGILRRSVPPTTPGNKGDHSVRHSAQVRFTSPWNAERNPKQHLSFRKTPVRNQQSMRTELNAWLTAQGKTPSKFRHLLCFGAEMSAQKNAPPPSSTPSLTVGQMSQQQQVIEKEGCVMDRPSHPAHTSSCTADHQDPVSTDQGAAEMADSLEFGSSNSEQEGKRSVEDRHSEGLTVLAIQEKLEAMMKEFNTLLVAGCPPHSILAWLEEIRQNVELARQSATFYSCCVRAQLAARNLNGVLGGLEEAIRCGAQPPERLADTFREVMQELTVTLPVPEVEPLLEATSPQPSKLNFDLTSTPNSSASIIEGEDGGDDDEEEEEEEDEGKKAESSESILQSSAIKYMVTRVTPFRKSSARKSRGEMPTEEEDASLLVVTPVRRSMRRSVTATPQSACLERNPQSLAHSGNRQRVLDCLEELASPELRNSIYTRNPALSRYSQPDTAP